MATPEVEYQDSLFHKMDNERKGYLFKENFASRVKSALQRPLQAEVVEEVFQKCNMQHSDKISQTEFVAATMSPDVYLCHLRAAFDDFDQDKDGRLGTEELQAVYRQ